LAEFAGMLLGKAHLAAAIAGALLAEWGAGRAGVLWSAPQRASDSAAVARRIVLGVALGLGAGGALLALTLLFRRGTLLTMPPSVSHLGLGLLVSVLASVRAEPFLRGMVIHALGKAAPEPIVLLACGVVGAAAEFGMGATSAGELASA